MITTTLRIEGMHCEGCAQTIRALLAAEAGVRAVSVSFPERRARVLYSPEATSDARLIAVIDRIGYRATLVAE